MSLNGDTPVPRAIPDPDRPPSVQRRILVRLVPLLTLLFAAVAYWLGETLESSLYSANLEIVRQSNAMAAYAVETSMVTEDDHQPWGLMTREFPKDENTEIEIISAEGVVVFSTDPSKRGVSYPLTDPSCSACHEGGSTRATTDTANIETPERGQHLVFAASLHNTASCQRCHTEDKRKLGLVRVERSLEPIHAQIRTVQTGIAIAGAVALVITMLTTHALLRRYVGRPLRTLVTAARAIGSGKLDHTVEVPDRGELTVLADTLNAATARLARLQEELVQSERLAAVGETVAGLAHCLKNTLNALRAGQYVVDRAVELNDPEKLDKGRQVMRNAVAQVERLTFDMLYYVKEREPELQSVDPNEIAREVVDLLTESAESVGVALRDDPDPAIGAIRIDRTAVYRALLNLVTNAIDACRESESGNLVVVRSRVAGPDEIVLTVEDDGIGISPEVRSRLFTRLFSTKAGRGTGLGLPVVKKIAEAHGGRVEVESEPGKGSTFNVFLPRAQD